jgi:nucleotidyltransferase/DNA polymerase involved in DNA repair
MAEKKAREYVAVRLSLDGVSHIKELAARETEGNLSQMVRKLLGEALAHRQGRDAHR